MVANVLLLIVFPILYCERDTEIRDRIRKREHMVDTGKVPVCAGGVMFVSSGCVRDWIHIKRERER